MFFLSGLGNGDGRVRLNGLVSGLDSDKIIKETAEAKLSALKNQEDKVTLNNDKAAAIATLKSHFIDLKGATDKLRSPPGYSFDQGNNILAAKKVFLSSGVVSNPSNYLEVTASNIVEKQNFDITVTSVAKNKIQKTSAFPDKNSSVTDATGTHNNGRFTAGTFQINSTDITLVEGDTLATIASKINAAKAITNVSAAIIQPNVGQYSIKLTATEAGVSNGYSITDAGNVLNDILSQPDTDVQTATDAVIKVDGITITRPTNIIEDYDDGLVIKVRNPTSDAITVDVDYDKQTAITAIAEFVDGYNKVVSYINEQQARDGQGQYLETAKIQRNAFVRDIKFSMLDLMSSNVDNGGFDDLSSIGLEFPNSSKVISDPASSSSLSIDATKLTDSVLNDYDSVRKLLEFQYQATSPNFKVTKRSNNIGNNTNFSITVDVSLAESERAKITYGSTTVNATYQPLDSADLTKGGFIIGPEGTPFEGFEFQYTGLGANETATISASQGVMDKLYNFLDGIMAKTYPNLSGQANVFDVFDLEIATLNEASSDTQQRIERERIKIDADTERQIAKFAEVEAQMAKANAATEFIKTQMDVMSRRQ